MWESSCMQRVAVLRQLRRVVDGSVHTQTQGHDYPTLPQLPMCCSSIRYTTMTATHTRVHTHTHTHMHR